MYLSFIETHLACKEVSTYLHYNLIILIRRLVPGYHHFCTGQVLQLIYLQPQENQNEPKSQVRTPLFKAFPLSLGEQTWCSCQVEPITILWPTRWLKILCPYRFSTLPNNSSSSKGGNLNVSLQLHLLLGSKEILFFQLTKDATLSLQPDEMRIQITHTFFNWK